MELELPIGGFPDRGPAVFAVTTATLVLASLFVGARLISRVCIVHRVGWDDYIMILAWFIAFFLSTTIDVGAKRGLGRHDADIADEHRMGLRLCEYIFSILYVCTFCSRATFDVMLIPAKNPALMATKTSVLVFYLRLAKNTQTILRMGSWAVLVIVNLAGVILTFMNVFQCQPIAAAWDTDVTSTQCIPLLTEFICSAPVNIVTDLAILALPLPVLTGMRLPPRQKTILILTFALGIFVTVVDVVRIYYLQQAIAIVPINPSADPAAIYGQSSGFSWNASLSLMWSAVEVNVGITCACIPTLKPLVIRILPGILVDAESTRRMSQQDTSGTKPESSVENSHPRPNGPQPSPSIVLPSPPPSPFAVREQRQQVHEDGTSEEISVRDFLSSTTVNALSPRNNQSLFSREHRPSFNPSTRSLTSQDRRRQSSTLVHSRDRHGVYFGFVNMRAPKSMLRTSSAESFKYCTVVSILFFLWGSTYGLLNTLNMVIADVAKMTPAETMGLTSIYFGGGYFLGPLLVGGWLLSHDEHHRFKTEDGTGCPVKQAIGVERRTGGGTDGRDPALRGERRNSRSGGDPIGGFKATFIVGLLIYGMGTIMFWPGAVLTAYGGFMASSFVVGFGLAVLETAANPFLALCGPPEYSDARLLFAQAVQAVGSVLSGLIANNIFFAAIVVRQERRFDSTALLDVQWTYLAVTLLSVFLALFFYYMPLPEVTDHELGRLAEKLPTDPKKRSIGGWPLRNWAILLAVLAQWCYVAAQENMSIFFQKLITLWVLPLGVDFEDDNGYGTPMGFSLSVLNYLIVAHTAFAVSRFAAGTLCYLSVRYPKVRWLPTGRTILGLSAICSMACCIASITYSPPLDKPDWLCLPVISFYFFEGPIWPLVFSLGLKGQGKRTKQTAAWLTMGASGPAFWPFVMYEVMERSRSVEAVRVSFIIVVMLMFFVAVYPAFLTFVKDARIMVDPLGHKGLLQRPNSQGENGGEFGGALERMESFGREMTFDEIVAERARQRKTRLASSGTASIGNSNDNKGKEREGEEEKIKTCSGGIIGKFFAIRGRRTPTEGLTPEGTVASAPSSPAGEGSVDYMGGGGPMAAGTGGYLYGYGGAGGESSSQWREKTKYAMRKSEVEDTKGGENKDKEKNKEKEVAPWEKEELDTSLFRALD